MTGAALRHATHRHVKITFIQPFLGSAEKVEWREDERGWNFDSEPCNDSTIQTMGTESALQSSD